MADERTNSPASTLDKVLQWTGSEVQTIAGTSVPGIVISTGKQSWTPSPAAVENITSIGTVAFATYVQQGNVVFFKFRINDVEPTATGISRLSFTLPVPTEQNESPINGVVSKSSADGYGVVDFLTASNNTEGIALFDALNTDITAVNISGNYIV